MTIRIQNENCVRGGRECDCDDEHPCGDCYEEDVSSEAVARLRARAKAAGAGTDIYLLRCARTVEAALLAAR